MFNFVKMFTFGRRARCDGWPALLLVKSGMARLIRPAFLRVGGLNGNGEGSEVGKMWFE